MPKKTIITTVTLGVHAPDLDMIEVRNANDILLSPGSRGLGHVAPGEPVTLDAAEADEILARYGGEVIEEIPDEAPPAGKSAGRGAK